MPFVIQGDPGRQRKARLLVRVSATIAQADSSSRRAHGGSGLGLSISKGIIDAHGGRIGFDSTTAGSTFYFELSARDV